MVPWPEATELRMKFSDALGVAAWVPCPLWRPFLVHFSLTRWDYPKLLPLSHHVVIGDNFQIFGSLQKQFSGLHSFVIQWNPR